jgi:hypothetical protein
VPAVKQKNSNEIFENKIAGIPMNSKKLLGMTSSKENAESPWQNFNKTFMIPKRHGDD